MGNSQAYRVHVGQRGHQVLVMSPVAPKLAACNRGSCQSRLDGREPQCSTPQGYRQLPWEAEGRCRAGVQPCLLVRAQDPLVAFPSLSTGHCPGAERGSPTELGSPARTGPPARPPSNVSMPGINVAPIHKSYKESQGRGRRGRGKKRKKKQYQHQHQNQQLSP